MMRIARRSQHKAANMTSEGNNELGVLRGAQQIAAAIGLPARRAYFCSKRDSCPRPKREISGSRHARACSGTTTAKATAPPETKRPRPKQLERLKLLGKQIDVLAHLAAERQLTLERPMLTKTSKPTFVQAAQAWLRLVIGHSEVTNGEARVGAVIFDHFNVGHYKQVGELVAWPKQETLIAESTLCRRAVQNAIEKFERLGLLVVEHGRYNGATQKRAVNVYHARPRCIPVHLGPRCKPKVHPSAHKETILRIDDKKVSKTVLRGPVEFLNGSSTRKQREEADSRGQPASES
jgi:hypothetical protein